MVFQAGDSKSPLIFRVPNWITTFSDLVEFDSITIRAMFH